MDTNLFRSRGHPSPQCPHGLLSALKYGGLNTNTRDNSCKESVGLQFFQGVVCWSHKDISNGDMRTEDENESRVTHDKDGRDAPFQPQLPPPPLAEIRRGLHPLKGSDPGDPANPNPPPLQASHRPWEVGPSQARRPPLQLLRSSHQF